MTAKADWWVTSGALVHDHPPEARRTGTPARPTRRCWSRRCCSLPCATPSDTGRDCAHLRVIPGSTEAIYPWNAI